MVSTGISIGAYSSRCNTNLAFFPFFPNPPYRHSSQRTRIHDSHRNGDRLKASLSIRPSHISLFGFPDPADTTPIDFFVFFPSQHATRSFLPLYARPIVICGCAVPVAFSVSFHARLSSGHRLHVLPVHRDGGNGLDDRRTCSYSRIARAPSRSMDRPGILGHRMLDSRLRAGLASRCICSRKSHSAGIGDVCSGRLRAVALSTPMADPAIAKRGRPRLRYRLSAFPAARELAAHSLCRCLAF